MRTLLFFTLLLGVLLYVIDRLYTPPPQTVEYRYLPRTWNMQLEDNAYSKNEIFKQMVDAESGNVWLQAYQTKKLV